MPCVFPTSRDRNLITTKPLCVCHQGVFCICHSERSRRVSPLTTTKPFVSSAGGGVPTPRRDGGGLVILKKHCHSDAAAFVTVRLSKCQTRQPPRRFCISFSTFNSPFSTRIMAHSASGGPGWEFIPVLFGRAPLRGVYTELVEVVLRTKPFPSLARNYFSFFFFFSFSEFSGSSSSRLFANSLRLVFSLSFSESSMIFLLNGNASSLAS